jgi:hypothetical protein
MDGRGVDINGLCEIEQRKDKGGQYASEKENPVCFKMRFFSKQYRVDQIE